ncbi:MAG: DNA polymerase III subunit delta [Thermoguttaceae bacterium]|jgi:DNA polymerase-3 subunit delta
MLCSAIDFLLNPGKCPKAPPIVVLFGDDVFLGGEVYRGFRDRLLGGGDAEFALVEYEGGDVRYSEVISEVSTPPMFGGDVRLVRISDADTFVANNREKLEGYLKAPSPTGVLLLQVKSFPSHWRLYGAVEAGGLLIDLAKPKKIALLRWLVHRTKFYGLNAKERALEVLIDQIGEEAGLLESELARLALTVSPDDELTEEFVFRNVGSWRKQKAWDIVNDALAGDFPKAVHQLDLLLAAGEQPISILAQMGVQIRRFCIATHLFLDAEKSGQRTGGEGAILNALKGAGFRFWDRTSKSDKLHPLNLMKNLGRHRGLKLADLLLQTDLDLKGGQRIDPRIILEELLTVLASREFRK